MAIGKEIESGYKAVRRTILRLWENINVVNYACQIAANEVRKGHRSILFDFPNVCSIAPKNMIRMECLNSLADIREGHAWKWCLIVAVSQFDAWMEDTVGRIHKEFPSLQKIAKSRKYRSATPSFSDNFFTKDMAAIGLKFLSGTSEVANFVKWKEAHNCLVHHGGQVTPQYAARCNPAPKEKSKLNLTRDQVREALHDTLILAEEIRDQLHEQIKLHLKRVKAGAIP